MAYKTQTLCILLCSPPTHINSKVHFRTGIDLLRRIHNSPASRPGAYKRFQIRVILIFPAKTTVRLMPVYSIQRLFIRILNFGIHSFKPLCFEKWLREARATGSIVGLFYEHSLSENRIASRSLAWSNECQYIRKGQWIDIVQWLILAQSFWLANHFEI